MNLTVLCSSPHPHYHAPFPSICTVAACKMWHLAPGHAPSVVRPCTDLSRLLITFLTLISRIQFYMSQLVFRGCLRVLQEVFPYGVWLSTDVPMIKTSLRHSAVDTIGLFKHHTLQAHILGFISTKHLLPGGVLSRRGILQKRRLDFL